MKSATQGAVGRRVAEVTVVLAVPDSFDLVRDVVRALSRQTIVDRLELVLVVGSAVSIHPDEELLEAFASWQVVEAGPLDSAGRERAIGVRSAEAPFVWFAEDHGFPERQLVEALLGVCREYHAVAGPVLVNANPDTMTSWADFLLNFGPYTDRPELEELGHLAWHKSLYPRDELLSFGDRLDLLLDVEGFLQEEMRRRGFSLFSVPEARLHHLNVSRPGDLLRLQVVNGRLYGSTRAQAWSRPRTLLYAASAPLAVAIRTRRLLGEIRRTGRSRQLLPSILPMLLLGLVANQLGEILGYGLGPGSSRRRKADAEFRRYRFMSDADCRKIFGVPHGDRPRELRVADYQ